MCLACYGGSYIPALSASCLSPISVVLLRLLISFSFVSRICCIFLLYFKLIVSTNMSGKGLIFYIYGVVGVEMTELHKATHEVCNVHCEVCTVNCLHQAAPYALLGCPRTLSAAACGEADLAVISEETCGTFWFWWGGDFDGKTIWLVKCSQSLARHLHCLILSHLI